MQLHYETAIKYMYKNLLMYYFPQHQYIEIYKCVRKYPYEYYIPKRKILSLKRDKDPKLFDYLVDVYQNERVIY